MWEQFFGLQNIKILNEIIKFILYTSKMTGTIQTFSRASLKIGITHAVIDVLL